MWLKGQSHHVLLIGSSACMIITKLIDVVVIILNDANRQRLRGQMGLDAHGINGSKMTRGAIAATHATSIVDSGGARVCVTD